LKGIAIGLSYNSKEILKRLKKTVFVNDIYIAGSSKDDGDKNEPIQLQKPREILLKKWPEIDLIIFIALILGISGMISVFKAVYLDKLKLNCACIGGYAKLLWELLV